MRLRWLLLLLLISPLLLANNEEEDAWLEAFDDSTEHVNEGVLVFRTNAPERPVHHLANQIIISGNSLESGWVTLQQCHDHIDNVPAAQIMFNRDRVRNLKVREYSDIAAAWVEGHSVQLKQVGKAARVCIDAETRALSRSDKGGYLLKMVPSCASFLTVITPCV
jgi:hypothetical protein